MHCLKRYLIETQFIFTNSFSTMWALLVKFKQKEYISFGVFAVLSLDICLS